MELCGDQSSTSLVADRCACTELWRGAHLKFPSHCLGSHENRVFALILQGNPWISMERGGRESIFMIFQNFQPEEQQKNVRCVTQTFARADRRQSARSSVDRPDETQQGAHRFRTLRHFSKSQQCRTLCKSQQSCVVSCRCYLILSRLHLLLRLGNARRD